MCWWFLLSQHKNYFLSKKKTSHLKIIINFFCCVYLFFNLFSMNMCWAVLLHHLLDRAIFLFQLSHFKSAFNVICLYPLTLFLTNVPLKECVAPSFGFGMRGETLIIHPFHLICWMWPSHLFISYTSQLEERKICWHSQFIINYYY